MVKRSVPDHTIHHSRVSPFIRRGVFAPGAIEIHCANRLSSSTIVSAQSACPLCRASTSGSFVCGLCTPVHPADFAFGESTISGAFGFAGGRAAAPVGACPTACALAAMTRASAITTFFISPSMPNPLRAGRPSYGSAYASSSAPSLPLTASTMNCLPSI